MLLLARATTLGVWQQWVLRLQRVRSQWQAGLQPQQLQQRQGHASAAWFRRQDGARHGIGIWHCALQRGLMASHQCGSCCHATDRQHQQQHQACGERQQQKHGYQCLLPASQQLRKQH